MSRKYPLMAAGIAIALAPACSDLVSPARTDTYELPAPDTSLDPARLAVGELIATPCAFGTRGDGLAHLRTRDEWALVDIYFGRGSAGVLPDRSVPTLRQRPDVEYVQPETVYCLQ
jgi:hypothetical protein